MITLRDKLIVLEDFRIDRNLPKYQKKKGKSDIYLTADSLTVSDFSEDSGIAVSNSARSLHLPLHSGYTIGALLSRVLAWFTGLFRRKPPKPISVTDFFISVKNSAKEIEVIKERVVGSERAIVSATKAGQVALVEELMDGLNAQRMEAQMSAVGVTKYLEEQSVVDFYKKSERGLRLDWIMNFTRQVPSDVISVKSRTDELELFDNYVVLHYDPDVKSYAETEKERLDKKRDPILFGLMKGCRKLYFVGDWKDDYCDLTLDQIADALGKDVVKVI